MATNARIPTVAAEEVDLSTIRVVVIVPELTMKKSLFSKEPTKNCKVNVKPDTRSLEVTADIEEKGDKVIKYAYKANKLPGDIVPDNCKTEYKKGQVIVFLKKSEECSWAVQLSKSGLDQDPDA
uniref:Uncharacterized protein LOC111103224 n=1 Tax=Crassostrea virginica TaxID=6565 RepID=A0A8B8AKE5_CRAVI|nr:uncharacterized protein LOC111103224 [Crassostrea virginica]